VAYLFYSRGGLNVGEEKGGKKRREIAAPTMLPCLGKKKGKREKGKTCAIHSPFFSENREGGKKEKEGREENDYDPSAKKKEKNILS